MRLYLTKEELALLLEEKYAVTVRLWDVDKNGEFLGFVYDGSLIKLRSPEECGKCGGTGEICFSSTSYGPCPECSSSIHYPLSGQEVVDEVNRWAKGRDLKITLVTEEKS